jgi:cytochrome P450
MNADMLGFLVACYRRYGSVFRVRALGRELTVLAGTAANVFAGRKGARYLRSFESWAPLGREYGAEEYIQSSDGERLSRYRQAFKRGYSSTLMADNIPLLVQIGREVLSTTSGEVAALDLFQRMVTEQLSQALTGYRLGNDVEVVRRFTHTALNVRVGRRPRAALLLPRYRAARRRLFDLGLQIVERHRAEKREQPDFVDDVLLAAEKHPDLLGSRGQLLLAVLGPFIAGLDTVANAATFMLYELLRHDDVARACHDEADRLFSAGRLSEAEMVGALSLRYAMMEALRLHPIAPGITRTVGTRFEFDGYEIQEGVTVLIAMSVPHFLEDVFPDPKRFDVSRFDESRAEHKRPGAYAPFGLGPHTCLGAGAAQIQLMTVVATVLAESEVTWAGPRRELPVRPDPTLTLGRRFRVRVSRRSSASR